ncbi:MULTISPECIES: glutaminase family protein [unclassified Sphingobacterium]|uniref:glutaminase family protein n=1 Tax=unclassified Sphingobacterium TaxID=2609468 RepID=UPI0025FA4A6E|nr:MULTISPECIES: glutaminase family protein [unclassified Sphingobacterium]
MKLKLLIATAIVCQSVSSFAQKQVFKNDLRAPAYPLVTIDPNTSAWSYSNELNADVVRHWTGKSFPLLGVLKVDGKSYRFLGKEEAELLPLARLGEHAAWTGSYVVNEPAPDWMKPSFDARQWKTGAAPFGTKDKEPNVETDWQEPKIWVRREVELSEDLKGKSVYIEFTHDDDAILYVNGIEVANTGNSTGKNSRVKLPDHVVKTLKKGKNILAGYCYNRVANGYFDFGLFTEKEGSIQFDNEAKQIVSNVQATQTHYSFNCGPVDLNITFTAPMFLDKLDLMARPVNYLSYTVHAKDGKKHQVQLYLEAAPNWALNSPLQDAASSSFVSGNLQFVKTGSKSQQVLGRKGDDLRIDWGYFYMAGAKSKTKSAVGSSHQLRSNFLKSENSSSSNGGQQLALMQTFDVSSSYQDKILLGYDDLYSIQYFGQNLRPYWNTNGNSSIEKQFELADKEYTALKKAADKFDAELWATALRNGGEDYAALCALAYRQAIAAHKLVKAPNGDLLLLSKENDSNGSIGTVDVTYPSAPIFLYYNPELAKALMNAIFYYSESNKWTKPFAAHDVGTYPLANGQTYGGDMPVEESGNMLILTYALAKVEGNAAYAKKHWKVLSTWVDYLVDKGLDPENQLCTDDFAGHFAHNANLSIKAILGIASYGYLAQMLGEEATAKKYLTEAKAMAMKWKEMAEDGDHYKLTFDKTGTWSQKYNMVWDKLLKMEIFDPSIRETEIKYYLGKQNKYGLPLDNRQPYTKTDWIIWTATMANDKPTFEAFLKPVYHFMNETKDRVPMSDWTYTDCPKRAGFKARSVVGGYFIKMLEEKLGKAK